MRPIVLYCCIVGLIIIVFKEYYLLIHFRIPTLHHCAHVIITSSSRRRLVVVRYSASALSVAESLGLWVPSWARQFTRLLNKQRLLHLYTDIAATVMHEQSLGGSLTSCQGRCHRDVYAFLYAHARIM